MNHEKGHFAREQETMFATLYGRALDYETDEPVPGDGTLPKSSGA